MAKKRTYTRRPKVSTTPEVIQNAAPTKHDQLLNGLLSNDLSYALGVDDQSLGIALGGPNSGVQLSQATTMFKNLRWYLVSNMRQLLTELYVEIGLVQTVVDIPVDDALRGGIDIKSKQLSEEQIEELKVRVKREKVLRVAGQAAKWNRLYGGAGVLTMTDQDPEEPLDLNAITPDTPLRFRSCDMWELFWDKQNTEGYNVVTEQENFDYYSFYGIKVHKSRVRKMVGIEAPSFIQPRLRGWGVSIVETFVRSLNQSLKASDLGFEVLDEFKLDVYKIKDLTNTLFSAEGYEKVRRRIAMANRQKNYQNAVVLDSEDEYDHKELSFTGIAEAMAGIRMQVASDLRMPLTKLYGISAAGFNSGEDDLEVYNAMVESQVRDKIEPDLLFMIEIMCQQMFGYIPEDLEIEFKPLRVMSTEQEENAKDKVFNRVHAARTSGLITDEEYRHQVNAGQLFPIPLETSNLDKLELGMTDDNEAVEGDEDDTFTQQAKIGGGKYGGEKSGPETKTAGEPPNRPDPYIQNSLGYDIAAYKTDGGDALFDDRRKLLVESKMSMDKSKYEKAKAASIAAFGKDNWKFTAWKFKSLGGKL